VPHQLAAGVSEPAQQGGVDPCDLPVRKRRQVAAGRVLVQVLGAVLEQRAEARVLAAAVFADVSGIGGAGAAHGGPEAKDAIAARVASGALSWGQ